MTAPEDAAQAEPRVGAAVPGDARVLLVALGPAVAQVAEVPRPVRVARVARAARAAPAWLARVAWAAAAET